MRSNIPISKPYLGFTEIAFVAKSILSNKVGVRSEIYDECEAILSKQLKVSNTILCSNGTDALILSLLALKELNKRTSLRVAVPNVTFAATVNAVILANCEPVLIGVDDETGLIDLEKVPQFIDVLIIVQLNGRLVPSDQIEQFKSKSPNTLIIEDCAESYLSSYEESFRMNYISFTTTSFYGNKFVTSGEGGSVSFTDEKYKKIIFQLMNHGMKSSGSYMHDYVGGNFRLPSINAHLLYAQLLRLDKIKKHRILHYQIIRNSIATLKSVKFQEFNSSEVPWLIEIKNQLPDRTFEDYLDSKGISFRPFFYPMTKQLAFKKIKYFGNEIHDNSFCDNRFFLPSFYGMPIKDSKYIAKSLNQYCNHE